MARKTRLMQQVEERYQQPLERLLPEMINDRGLSSTALSLEVSKATLGYWLLKLGINVRRVALAPGESLEVKRTSEGGTTTVLLYTGVCAFHWTSRW